MDIKKIESTLDSIFYIHYLRGKFSNLEECESLAKCA
jgi:hypothetical protein